MGEHPGSMSGRCNLKTSTNVSTSSIQLSVRVQDVADFFVFHTLFPIKVPMWDIEVTYSSNTCLVFPPYFLHIPSKSLGAINTYYDSLVLAVMSR